MRSRSRLRLCFKDCRLFLRGTGTGLFGGAAPFVILRSFMESKGIKRRRESTTWLLSMGSKAKISLNFPKPGLDLRGFWLLSTLFKSDGSGSLNSSRRFAGLLHMICRLNLRLSTKPGIPKTESVTPPRNLLVSNVLALPEVLKSLRLFVPRPKKVASLA